MEQIVIVKRSLSDLKKAGVNIRIHPDKQMAEYRRSVKKHGILKLPVIDENNVIWCGNGLYDAMLAEGYTECECILKAGMTETEKRKMMMSENKIFDLGVDDMSVFDEFIAEMNIEDLDIPGYSEELLQSLKMDATEIDDVLSNYGIIGDEKKAEIEKASNAYERAEVKAQSEESAAESVPEKYIICPHCGEKIWL